MKDIRYRNFSLRTHKKNLWLNNPSVCQFELTFRCDLHCKYCYTDCYNKPRYLKKELKTKEIISILDKAHKAGVIWLCFTGGDPLIRRDFLDIYSHARDKGFIITVFTSGYSTTEEIVKYFKKRPPFVIEITLNAAREDLYENISRVKGSFAKVMRGVNLILKEGLPLKIKTQIMRDNLGDLPRIKKFIEGLGLEFRPSHDLHARLNGDLVPCDLRISSYEILYLDRKKRLPDDDRRLTPNADLFRCIIAGGDGFHIDPSGNIYLCDLIRKPAFNLLKVDLEYALNKLLSLVKDRKFTTDSKCKNCRLSEFCQNCPGRAYLERGDMEAPVEYYCELARAIETGNG